MNVTFRSKKKMNENIRNMFRKRWNRTALICLILMSSLKTLKLSNLKPKSNVNSVHQTKKTKSRKSSPLKTSLKIQNCLIKSISKIPTTLRTDWCEWKVSVAIVLVKILQIAWTSCPFSVKILLPRSRIQNC